MQSLSEIEAKVKHDERRWKIFESFLGLIQSSSPLPELEKFVKLLPDTIDEVKLGKYSPELLRNYVLGQLTGPELQVVKCKSCQAGFNVDKPPKLGDYYCPICGLSHTFVDKDASAILKAALYAPKKQGVTIVQQITPIQKKPKTENGQTG